MSKIIIAPEAQKDLNEVLGYIAQDNPKAAAETLFRIEDDFLLLASNPKMGVLRSDLFKNLRAFPVGNYIIFYREIPAGIEVARVLHGARDVSTILQK